MKANAFLTSLGKDQGDEDELPRRRKKTAEAPAPAPAAPADPAPAEAAPAPDEAPSEAPAPEQATPEPTPSQRRAAQRRTQVEDVVIPGVPVVGARPRVPEPVHKTSVDLRWSLKMALQELVERDRRGPKAELNDALEAWLTAKGIEIPEWKG